MDNSIKVSNEVYITIPDYPGFALMVPNGTNIFKVNKVISLFMDWTVKTINIPSNKAIEPTAKDGGS